MMTSGLVEFFSRCWRGQESLAKAYWLLAVVCGILLVTIIAVIFSFFVPIADIVAKNSFYQKLITAIMLPFTIFSTVCVWRCGKNSTLIWKLISRLLMILATLDGLYALFQVLKK